MTNNSNNGFGKVVTAMNKWYNAALFVILLATGIAYAMNSRQEIKRVKDDIAKLEKRVEKTEEVNYELLSEQLNEIRKANNELTKKIDKTNERVDKVLEILIDK